MNFLLLCMMIHMIIQIQYLPGYHCIGSVWVTEENKDKHWINSGLYGTLRLISDTTTHNHACQLTGSIEDFTVSDKETELIIVADLTTVFYDPDGDSLIYTIQYDNPDLIVPFLMVRLCIPG